MGTILMIAGCCRPGLTIRQMPGVLGVSFSRIGQIEEHARFARPTR
jgi:hypothetical protein